MLPGEGEKEIVGGNSIFKHVCNEERVYTYGERGSGDETVKQPKGWGAGKKERLRKRGKRSMTKGGRGL